MHERVEAAAVRHAEHDFLDAELPAALEDLLDSGDQRFAAIEAEALGADELDAEIVLEALRLDDPLQDHLATLERELGVVLDMLDTLLDPRLLVGIGDMHELDADLAAVGLAQAVHDLAKRRLLAECQRAKDQDRAVPIALGEAVGRGIELAMRRLPHQAQRIEVGLEMAADTVGADQHQRLGGVVGGGADLGLALAGQCRRRCGTVALHVPVGGSRRFRHVDDARAVGRPRGAAHLSEHAVPVLGQRLEEGPPLGVDPARVALVARVQFLDEGRIGAEQERCLLCLHGLYSSQPSSPFIWGSARVLAGDGLMTPPSAPDADTSPRDWGGSFPSPSLP